MAKINAGSAMVKVLEDWGVDHIYGIPGGSFNSTMDALFYARDKIKYIQVRHEEVGALAAVADAKLTGKVGVVFGSAGPGATHLIQGLYDAQMDHVPLVALLGQVAHNAMNTYAFQELNENPMFADVAIYNRTVMSPEQLPLVVDNAIKEAYEHKGVAVVTIPVDFGTQEIEDTFQSNAHTLRYSKLEADPRDIEAAAELIAQSKRPYLYIGVGARGGWPIIKRFSEHFSMPVGGSALSRGIIPDDFPNFMGMAGRVAMKPGVEVPANADLIIFAGSDFPFGQFFFPKAAKFIQINTDKSSFGKRHHVDVAVLGDAVDSLSAIMAIGQARPEDGWLKAAQENKKEWDMWCHSFDEYASSPLRVEPIYKAINDFAADDAIFVTDVGNVTVNSVRHLHFNGTEQKFMTSGLFATMGNAIPGGIGAKLSYPDRQVITLSGDGGALMMIQGIQTQVQYKLPIVNVIFSNRSLGFIEAEQEDTKQTKFGVFLDDIDFAKVAEGLGAVGVTVTNLTELEAAFTLAGTVKDGPIVIDVKIEDARPLPVEQLVLDTKRFTSEEIADFVKTYQADGLTAFEQILEKYKA